MHTEPETFVPVSEAELVRKTAKRWGMLFGSWLGFLFGVLFMAFADITDLHICIGECDGQGLTLWGTVEK